MARNKPHEYHTYVRFARNILPGWETGRSSEYVGSRNDQDDLAEAVVENFTRLAALSGACSSDGVVGTTVGSA